MKPVKFKGYNFNLQTKEGTTPLYKDIKGNVLTCWKMNIFEAIKLLFTRKIWHLQIANGKPIQGISFTINKSELFSKKKPEQKLKKVA